jgi:hypothetical protein
MKAVRERLPNRHGCESFPLGAALDRLEDRR